MGEAHDWYELRSPGQRKTGRPSGPAGPSKLRCLRCRPRRCRLRQRSGRPTPCGGGTPSPRGKGRGTASRATPTGGCRLCVRDVDSDRDPLQLPYKRLAINSADSVQARQDRSLFVVGEHDRSPGRLPGTLDTHKQDGSLLNYLAVEQRHGVRHVVPYGRRDVAVDRESGQKHLSRLCEPYLRPLGKSFWLQPSCSSSVSPATAPRSSGCCFPRNMMNRDYMGAKYLMRRVLNFLREPAAVL